MAPFMRGTGWPPEKVQVAAYIVGTIVAIVLIVIAVLPPAIARMRAQR